MQDIIDKLLDREFLPFEDAVWANPARNGSHVFRIPVYPKVDVLPQLGDSSIEFHASYIQYEVRPFEGTYFGDPRTLYRWVKS